MGVSRWRPASPRRVARAGRRVRGLRPPPRTACPRGRGVVDPRFHPRHWMLPPEGHCLYPGHTRLRGRVRFFNLRTGAIASVALPIFKDHFALDSVDGLLLLQRDHDMAVRRLHPFTGDIVDLPSLATLLPQLAAHFNPFERAHMQEIEFLKLIRHVCAAVSYSPEDGVITVLLALTKEHVPRVAFATSKDQQWTLSSWESPGWIRIMSLLGKLYFFTAKSQFLMVEPPPQHGSSLQPPKLIATCPPDKIRCPYLAECDSEVLLVGYPDSFSLDIVIYRLSDLVLGRITPLKSIGGNSIFLVERSICISSKAHPTISGDSVVCLHNVDKYVGEYHLESRTWSAATDGDVMCGPIPSPYTLKHHIYTCCDRVYWNKGQIYWRAVCPKWGAKSRWRRGG